jgi:hypothetical protein
MASVSCVGWTDMRDDKACTQSVPDERREINHKAASAIIEPGDYKRPSFFTQARSVPISASESE